MDYFDLLIDLFDLFNDLLIKLDRNRDRQFGLVVGFRIGPKSTIEFGQGFRFDEDNSIRYP